MNNQIVDQFKNNLKNAGNLDVPTSLAIAKETLQTAKTAGVSPTEIRSVVDETWGPTNQQDPATSHR